MINYISKIFNLLLGIASVTSIITVYTQQSAYITISFHIFIFCLLGSIVTFKLQENGVFRKNKFETIFVHARWDLFDEKHASYEVQRVIKAKKIFIGSIIFNHGWSGRGDVRVSSIDNKVDKSCDKGEIKVKYPTNIMLNETRAIQYRIDTVDADGHQKPYLYWSSNGYTDMVVLEAIIRYKDEMEDAIITTSFTDKSDEGSWEEIARIPFDKTTHSFKYTKKGVPSGIKLWMKWKA